MIYVEVFGGVGSVLLNKERSVREVLNDANGNLINLYRVVREHPVRPMETRFILFREEPRWLEQAAAWFHQKWGVPQEAYRESMLACLAGESPVPQWYLAVEGERIVGGLGVIENDFHPRKDLAPNVCAVYVEEDRRCRGIAGRLLELACQDMAAQGVPTLYLLTDHTGFYERYGCEYLCPVRGDGEERDTRVYVHR